MKKRTNLFLIVFSLIFAMGSLNSVVFAASTNNYDQKKALSYAVKYYNSLTRREQVKKKADCVMFIRSSLEYGGIPIERSYEYTPNDYVTFLLKKGFVRSNLSNTRPEAGDLILYRCNTCNKYWHISMAMDRDMHIVHHNVNGKIGAKGAPFSPLLHSKNGVKHNNVSYYILHYFPLKKCAAPKVAKSSSKFVKVRWNPVSTGCDGYQISKSTKSSKISINKTVNNSKSTTASLKTSKGKKLYYRIRTYRKVASDSGIINIYGPWSNAKAFILK